MNSRLPPALFLDQFQETSGVMIDVRSPGEFAKGHIPGAYNIPLFSNEERALVGTLYKKEGPSPALLKGLELVGPKLHLFIKDAQQLASSPGTPLFVYCWRGGQRSRSMAWLLSLVGFNCTTLEGGYKAFRRMAQNHFQTTLYSQLLVLGGMTGSGKTATLKELKKRGAQVVDLEDLAHHKGSAFGSLGEKPQPSIEHFENKLYMALRSINPSLPLWIEDESHQVGQCLIPNHLFHQMRMAPVVKIEVDRNVRLKRLVEDYASFPLDEIKRCLYKIERRLGGQHLKEALQELELSHFTRVAEITLNYYDKAYQHGLSKREDQSIHPVVLQGDQPQNYAIQLIDWLEEKGSTLWNHLS